MPRAAPCAAHPLGTDNFGRDILSRVMAGSGSTFFVAVCTVLIGCVFGTIVGALTGEEPQVFLSYATKTTKSEAQSVFGSAQSREERTVSAAVVLCRGGELPSVQKNLLEVLSTALQIGTNRIYIGPKTN